MSKEFLKIAKDILKNLDNYTGRQKEFYVRTGISRAYYGLIWYLRDRLSKQGYNFKGKNLHSYIPRILMRMGKLDEAFEFENLKIKRNDADYNLKSEFKKLKTLDKKTLKTYIRCSFIYLKIRSLIMVTVKDFKITKKIDSKKILKDVEKILNDLGVKDKYELELKDITQEDTIIKPLYSVDIDIHKKLSEKKRIEIKETVLRFIKDNYGVNFVVDVLTD